MTNDKLTSISSDGFSADMERLRFAIKVSGVGIWEVEPVSNTVRWDERCRELFGLAAGHDIPYEQALRYIHDDDRIKVDAAVQAAMSGQGDGRYDVQYRTTGADDGKLRWVRFRGQALFDDNGSLIRFGGIAEDITGLITTARTATEAQSLAKVALESAGAGYFRIQLQTDEIEYSPTFAKILTGSVNITLSRADFIRYIHPEDRELREAAYVIAAQTGKLNYEARNIWDDGSIHWMQTTGTYLAGPDGKHAVFTGTVRDITDRVEQSRRMLAGEARFRDIIEQAPMAIGLLRGRNMVIELGNDKIFALWGKDASITGLPIMEALPEIKGQPFLELLEGVYDTGTPFFGNGVLARLKHAGRLADLYFDFTYTPLRNAEGTITGVMVLATEVTARELARKSIEESESRFRSLVENTPDVITRWDKDLKLIFANSTFAQKIGASPETLAGKTNKEMGQPAEITVPYMESLRHTFDTGLLQEHYNNFPTSEGTATYHSTLVPERDATGKIVSVLSIARNVTELKRSEERLRTIIAAAPAGIGLFVGRDLVIEYPNQTFIDIVGKGPGIEGLPLREAMPELITEGQPFLNILDDVFTTGKMFQSFGSQVRIIKNGVMTDNYYNITYTPVFDEEGKVYAILDIAIDVTEQIKTVQELDEARQKLEASEGRLRSLVESAPFPIGVYTGKEMRIRFANQTILDIWGKGDQVIGKLYPEILPELENQAIFEQLDQVFTTGIPFHARNQRVDVMVNGSIRIYYFNYSFTPLFDEDNNVYGVMNTAADVTDLVLARQRAEEAEATLRSAISVADLGTWIMDADSGVVSYSSRIREWFGFATEETGRSVVFDPIHIKDRQRIADAITKALQHSGTGMFDEEYTVIARDTGRRRILHAQGKTVFDAAGRPLRISGTIQDVTIHRRLQLALENEVQQRTEELAAINEELRATNEELGQSNQLLTRSNEELTQYAYVASHDLQEPLRKIRMFAGLLSDEKNLPPDLAPLVGKIDKSAERMSLLIRDLLDFSRLLRSDNLVRPVNLAEVAANVINDFELMIEDKKATVTIGTLPQVHAVGLQMNQLFYNLLSNALKFSKPGNAPLIEIDSALISQEEAAAHISKPLLFARYHHITVKDNGVGFDTKYSEHIFEVFKRLHGRELYPGSGIGLAMCRRIADNHNGRLYAESIPGEGSVFHLLLPDKQQEYEPVLPAGFKWTND